MQLVIDIISILIGFLILFFFFGGTLSIIIATICSIANNLTSSSNIKKIIFTSGLLISAGFSYWSCQYMTTGKLFMTETIVAIVMSLFSYFFSFRFFKKYL